MRRKPEPLDVECPECGAQEGFRCTTNWGFRDEYRRPTKPHAARLRAAEKAREEKEENRG